MTRETDISGHNIPTADCTLTYWRLSSRSAHLVGECRRLFLPKWCSNAYLWVHNHQSSSTKTTSCRAKIPHNYINYGNTWIRRQLCVCYEIDLFAQLKSVRYEFLGITNQIKSICWFKSIQTRIQIITQRNQVKVHCEMNCGAKVLWFDTRKKNAH